MVMLDLPYPPSLNRYYRHVGAKVLISREGRLYREKVVGLVRARRLAKMTCHAYVGVVVHPPDYRRRDIDNILKALLDALVHAGALEDDSLIKELNVTMSVRVNGGRVAVGLDEMSKVLDRRLKESCNGGQG